MTTSSNTTAHRIVQGTIKRVVHDTFVLHEIEAINADGNKIEMTLFSYDMGFRLETLPERIVDYGFDEEE